MWQQVVVAERESTFYSYLFCMVKSLGAGPANLMITSELSMGIY